MENPQRDMLKDISLVYRKTQMYLNERTKQVQLSSGLAPFIMITCENGKMTQNRFCELLDISKSTVTKMLSKLEALGYVTRVENQDDARSVDVYPTQKAREIYPYLISIGQDWMDEITQGLTKIERSIFLEMLEKISLNTSRYFEK
ncbi:MAG: MarR family winged helix-turn-helix transcriptional regulator [Massiliimalia sp.]|jgi:DNA-binding MarR family transcriptional regulator